MLRVPRTSTSPIPGIVSHDSIESAPLRASTSTAADGDNITHSLKRKRENDQDRISFLQRVLEPLPPFLRDEMLLAIPFSEHSKIGKIQDYPEIWDSWQEREAFAVSATKNADPALRELIESLRFSPPYLMNTLKSLCGQSIIRNFDIKMREPQPDIPKPFVPRNIAQFRAFLPYFHDLSSLDLRYCDEVNDEDLKSISDHCPGLKRLDLSGPNHLNDKNITDIGIAKLPRGLTHLNLNGLERLTNLSFRDLPHGLIHLELYRSDISDAAIDMLPQSLTHLDLSYCKKLTDKAITNLPRGLLHLNLLGTDITDAAIAEMPRELQYLGIAQCNISDAAIPALPANLTHLDVSSNARLTNVAIANLPRGLESLHCNFCDKLNDEAIVHLPRGLKSLEWHCSELTDAAITNLPTTLKELVISACKGITDDAIAALPRGIINLTISYCPQLTNQAIANLPKDLKLLHIDGCWKLTDAAIAELPRRITSLDISDLPNLSNIAITKLPQGLTDLTVGNNPKLTEAAISTLPTSLIILKVAHFEKLRSPDVSKLMHLTSVEFSHCNNLRRITGMNELENIAKIVLTRNPRLDMDSIYEELCTMARQPVMIRNGMIRNGL